MTETTTQVGGIDSNQLNSYFDRIERIEEEIKEGDDAE